MEKLETPTEPAAVRMPYRHRRSIYTRREPRADPRQLLLPLKPMRLSLLISHDCPWRKSPTLLMHLNNHRLTQGGRYALPGHIAESWLKPPKIAQSWQTPIKIAESWTAPLPPLPDWVLKFCSPPKTSPSSVPRVAAATLPKIAQGFNPGQTQAADNLHAPPDG